MPAKKATIYFSIFILLLTGSLSFVPGYNGDMPFYIVTAITMDGKTDQEAISETKSILRAELTGGKLESHLYRLDHNEKNTLDYYRIKPLYIFIIKVLHNAGLSFVHATLIPSLLSFFLIGYIVFMWAIKVFKPEAAMIFSVILILTGPAITLARLSTPDPFSNLCLLVCLYRIYFSKKYFWTTVILLGSIIIRLDNFISVIVLLTLIRFWPDRKITAATYYILIGLAVFIAIGINYYFESDFWWFRNFTYFQSTSAYLRQVLVYFLSLSMSIFPALFLLAFFIFYYHTTSTDKKTGYILLAIASILLLRFFAFPSFDERFTTAYCLCAFLVMLETLVKERRLEISPGKKELANV